MKNYLKDINRVKILSKKEQLSLYKKMRNGDIEARNLLIEGVLPWVINISKKYAYEVSRLEEIVASANLELSKKIHRWRPKKGELSTFVYTVVTHHLNRIICENLVIRVPKTTQKTVRRKDFDEILEKSSPNRRLELIFAKKIVEPDSLGDENIDANDHHDFVTNIAYTEELVLRTVQLAKIKQSLSPREQQFLDLRFNKGLTLREVGENGGYSRQYAEILLKSVVDKMRRKLAQQFHVTSFGG